VTAWPAVALVGSCELLMLVIRKMQGSWSNGKPYYRCVFLSQYAAKNKIKHPPHGEPA
jgi:hypothetical protein